MKRLRILLLSAFAVFVLSGCLQVRTVVAVNRDGSGTLEETFILKREIMEMLAGFSPDGTGADVLDRDRLQSQAAGMGEGVELVSVEPVRTGVGEGYRAVFSFEDIGTLRVNQNPGDRMPGEGAAGETVEEFVTFAFRKGSPAELRIRLPEPDDSDEYEEEDGDFEDFEDDGAASDEEFFDDETIREFYRNMRISFEVQVDGSIVDTNAAHARGSSTVVLMDMDFNRILADPAAMELLMNGQDQTESLEEMKELVDSVDGIDVELEREVLVRFR